MALTSYLFFFHVKSAILSGNEKDSIVPQGLGQICLLYRQYRLPLHPIT